MEEEMNDKPCLIYDDPRPISAIWLFGENAGGWKVGGGDYGCDRIVAYREHGLADWVAYYAVYEGDEIVARVSAAQVIVNYAKASQ